MKTDSTVLSGKQMIIYIVIPFFLFISLILIIYEYGDVSGSGKGVGRTKNSIAVLISGIVGHKLHDNCNISMIVHKNFYPNSKVNGRTSTTYIGTRAELLLANASFTGDIDSRGFVKGVVDKSELDWTISQVSENKYKIERWGWKFDESLEITVKDGKIFGTYYRDPSSFDWEIRGTYDNENNVFIDIDGPLNLGIVLDGKITPTEYQNY